MEQMPDAERYFVTIDIDGIDPSVAPGTGTPSPGGFSYDEANELLEALAKKGEIVGFDFVEVHGAHNRALAQRPRQERLVQHRAVHCTVGESRKLLGGSVIVTRDGRFLFLYAWHEESAQEAELIVKRIMDDQKLEEGTVLRVGVTGGGCSGFSYALGFDKQIDV